jgi:aconitate hydratase
MIGAGLLCKKAFERGIKILPYIKTSLSPGSQAVSKYFELANLTKYLEGMGFYHAGYGCMTCIGNSGDLDPLVD